MKTKVFFLSVFIIFSISSCKKAATPLTDYIQLNQNGRTVYYSVTKAYWQVMDTGKAQGKNYYVTAYQAFTDSLNYITFHFRDNTTPTNHFCPASGIYSDILATSSGCSDSAKNCMGFSMGCFFSENGQFNTTADSTSPPMQLNIFSCDNSFQQISGTFQCRLSYGLIAISITDGQFNDVTFTNQ